MIACKLSHELSKCKRWLVDNKLSLHVGKTECILFGTNRRLKGNGTYNVTCDGMAVNRVTSVKYLGVTLDQNFKFSDHVSLMIKNAQAALVSFIETRLFKISTVGVYYAIL